VITVFYEMSGGFDLQPDTGTNIVLTGMIFLPKMNVGAEKEDTAKRSVCFSQGLGLFSR
jgi:hypothetical protein